MGKFADIITSEADWEKNWTPAELEDRWDVYVNGPLALASEALQGAWRRCARVPDAGPGPAPKAEGGLAKGRQRAARMQVLE